MTQTPDRTTFENQTVENPTFEDAACEDASSESVAFEHSVGEGSISEHPAPDSKALLFDYRQAANPVRRGLTEPIPYRCWGPELHTHGPSAILPLDLSAELGAVGPATSPGLAAHFIRIEAGEGVKAAANATSSLFYVLRGAGRCERPSDGSSDGSTLPWQQGDLFVLPAGAAPLLQARRPRPPPLPSRPPTRAIDY